MIVLNKENISKYIGMDSRLDRALQLIAAGVIDRAPLGKTEDSAVMNYIGQKLETKPFESTRWESHERWIDIQYVISGLERIDVLVSRKNLAETERDDEVDVAFYRETGTVRGNQLYMTPGTLAVFYPEDVHRPCIAVGEPQTVKKVVVKIRV